MILDVTGPFQHYKSSGEGLQLEAWSRWIMSWSCGWLCPVYDKSIGPAVVVTCPSHCRVRCFTHTHVLLLSSCLWLNVYICPLCINTGCPLRLFRKTRPPAKMSCANYGYCSNIITLTIWHMSNKANHHFQKYICIIPSVQKSQYEFKLTLLQLF